METIHIEVMAQGRKYQIQCIDSQTVTDILAFLSQRCGVQMDKNDQLVMYSTAKPRECDPQKSLAALGIRPGDHVTLRFVPPIALKESTTGPSRNPVQSEEFWEFINTFTSKHQEEESRQATEADRLFFNPNTREFEPRPTPTEDKPTPRPETPNDRMIFNPATGRLELGPRRTEQDAQQWRPFTAYFPQTWPRQQQEELILEQEYRGRLLKMVIPCPDSSAIACFHESKALASGDLPKSRVVEIPISHSCSEQAHIVQGYRDQGLEIIAVLEPTGDSPSRRFYFAPRVSA